MITVFSAAFLQMLLGKADLNIKYVECFQNPCSASVRVYVHLTGTQNWEALSSAELRFSNWEVTSGINRKIEPEMKSQEMTKLISI